jgi:hypothetical protein
MKTAVPLFLIAVGFLAVEVLLGLRIWAQATAEPIDSEEMVRLFEVTDDLASPFEAITGRPPLHTTGVIDFTVLVAVEGYFVVTLIAVFMLLFLGSLISFVLHHRVRSRPAFVAKIEAPRRRRLVWQPVMAEQHPGRRYYLTFVLPDRVPLHREAGMGTLQP